ncbi:MAG TPA: MarR family transcriptional regulator [Solirubrobacteraceae bacterium]
MTDRAPFVGVRLLINRKVLAAYRHRTAVARRLDMSESEIAALTHLAEGGMTPGELGRRLQLTSGGMTALLHRLHRAGHIVRRRHPTDRRSVIVSASPVVLQRIAELYAPLAADADELTAQLSEHDREVVHRYLEAIVASSERRADELVADAEAAEVLPDEDALHLWA